ncbi:type 2 isopentenyl-diphosphate Delta-isomerase [Vaginisenegalia massiliensis]|uniref:type 2 isopentenyl-diphosphate Delta-isomerase n=1 Tax=Vaginisenegalia massiliensis TaxID=2058294 RepID=UPI001F150F1E|nr:type 2 isopentenyl-diphosphate Delta-isomerase [Vaginisenegalia massiliensis]
MPKETPISIAQQRKNDHIRLALAQQEQVKASSFDQIRFVHHSFAPIRYDQIDISTQWAGHHHALPFYINGMTGGSRYAKQFNQALAQVAKETGLTMASGSVSAALSEPDLADTFQIIRQTNPNGFILANLGAHHNLENAKRAVEILQANALQIHLNVPQEVVMPEGDRDFTTWSTNIEAIVNGLGIPVVVKEVGFGMSQETIQHLVDLGVQTVDVSGRGGTNFIQIENDRRDTISFDLLGNWGQSTAEALLEAQTFIENTEILASGGIRTYLDVVKALSLGARGVGLSGKFLHMVKEDGVDATIEFVHNWQTAIQHVMLMLGCQNISDLRKKTDLILSGDLLQWAQVRGIEPQHLANRSRDSRYKC